MMQSQIRKPLLLVLICFMFFTTSCASMDDDSMYDDYKENADSLANVDAQKTKELVNEGYAYVSAVAALATHNNNLEEALKNLNESYDGGSYKLKQYRLPNHGQHPLPPPLGPERFTKPNTRSNPVQSKFESHWSNVYVPIPKSREYNVMYCTSDGPSDAGDLGELIWIMFILATLSAIMYAVYWMFKRAED
eukprot:949506_1